MSNYHIAQATSAKMRAPFDHPVRAGFVEQLEGINSIADESPEFVWHLQTIAGDAAAICAFDDELILFDMPVSAAIEALHNYVYRLAHRKPLQDWKAWFNPITDRPTLVLWSVPDSDRPTARKQSNVSSVWPPAAQHGMRSRSKVHSASRP